MIEFRLNFYCKKYSVLHTLFSALVLYYNYFSERRCIISVSDVKYYFKQYNKEQDVLELKSSSATVELAAQSLGVIPARIVKTLSFKTVDGCILICTTGDMKIDNKKFKTTFGFKAKMLSPDEVLEFTGHAIGGVCPFALPETNNIKVFCDISLQRFETVFPACGSSNSAIKLTCDELFIYSNSLEWIDVCSQRS